MGRAMQFPKTNAARQLTEGTMAKLVAVVAILVGFLLVAPVVEYSAVESTNIFTAIGNAEGGGGGD